MLTLIEALADALPASVARRIAREHLQLLAQMVQFGMVGVAGFVVDTGMVYALRFPFGLYAAGAMAYVAAVTTTWWLNRIWTFRGRGAATRMHLQWMRFVAATLPGLVLNLGSYFTLVALSPLCAANPVLAVAAGALAGMTANFILSRAVVFQ